MLLAIMTFACRTPIEECGPPDAGAEEGCAVDPCAKDCINVKESVECCIANHGRLKSAADAGNNAWFFEARPECVPSEFLSPDAALCIAQVYGLPVGRGGEGSCRATSIHGGSCGEAELNPVWDIHSKLWNPDTFCDQDPLPLLLEGATMTIDAITGEFVRYSQIHTAPAFPQCDD